MRVAGLLLAVCAAAARLFGVHAATRGSAWSPGAALPNKWTRLSAIRTTAVSAERIRNAGRKLHITNKRFSKADWRVIEQVRPDSVAAEHYTELLDR